MTLNFTGTDLDGAGLPVDLLAETSDMLRESAELVVLTMRDVRAGKFGEVKTVNAAMKELRQTYLAMMDERTRVDKLRKEVAGVADGHTLDFDAARDEIGRRLACLRDA